MSKEESVHKRKINKWMVNFKKINKPGLTELYIKITIRHNFFYPWNKQSCFLLRNVH